MSKVPLLLEGAVSASPQEESEAARERASERVFTSGASSSDVKLFLGMVVERARKCDAWKAGLGEGKEGG